MVSAAAEGVAGADEEGAVEDHEVDSEEVAAEGVAADLEAAGAEADSVADEEEDDKLTQIHHKIYILINIYV